MGDGDLLMRAIPGEPDDDGLRLVYADWLEGHGQPERAEFIRVQVSLAKHPRNDALKMWDMGYHTDAGWRVQKDYDALRRRERELEAMPLAVWREHCRPLVHDGSGPDWSWTFRRGFIEAVTCAAADWLAHADAILAAQPVREVTLTTWPDVLVGYSTGEVSLPGRDWHQSREIPDLDNHRREVTLFVLAAEWPRIAFALPGATVGATSR